MTSDEYFDAVKILLKQYGAKHAVLFGSRAKGTAMPHSDFDIAVSGVQDIDGLRDAIYEIPSLFSTDLVDLDRPLSKNLREDIKQYGIQI
ncbi:MAG: nucleotidyltransferase family protein [Candidatus Weimeria sp.]